MSGDGSTGGGKGDPEQETSDPCPVEVPPAPTHSGGTPTGFDRPSEIGRRGLGSPRVVPTRTSPDFRPLTTVGEIHDRGGTRETTEGRGGTIRGERDTGVY